MYGGVKAIDMFDYASSHSGQVCLASSDLQSRAGSSPRPLETGLHMRLSQAGTHLEVLINTAA